MPLGKKLNKPPREVAQTIVERLQKQGLPASAEIAGPGFINLKFNDEWLAGQVQSMASGDRLGIEPTNEARTFVIDYSSPNVAKPMHVGHLRSTIIGDALTRLMRFLGHKAISDNHLGDWGTQFGMLLYGYKHLLNRDAYEKDPVRELARLYLEVRQLDQTFATLALGLSRFQNPQALQLNPLAEISRVYMQALRKAKHAEDEEDAPGGTNPVKEAYRAETAKLHSGDAENRRLWEQFMPACYDEIERIYRRLDVHFDHQLGESFYQPKLAEVVSSLLAGKIAQHSEGAVVVKFGDDQPAALVQKSDGAFTYTTTDLATIKYRVEEWKPDAILYVVDFRQGLHFKNLFEVARRWGMDGVELTHVSFGSVLGSDRKPIKTREGGGASLESLLNEAVARAELVYLRNQLEAAQRGETVSELNDEERREVFEVIGIGAVKYADLSQNRESDYVFNWDKMLAMEGNTATYMQYAYVRNRGIFRKGNIDVLSLRQNPPSLVLPSAEERSLALQLLRFHDALTVAAAESKPSVITSYLWDLAKSYSGFFQNCPVLKAESESLRQSRLLLCDLTARVIQRGLDLLGIRTVERM